MIALRLLTLALALALLGVYLAAGIGLPAASVRGVAAVLVIPFLFALVSHSPGEILCAFGDAFRGGRADTPADRLEAGTSALEALGTYSLATGVLGTLWALTGALNETTALGANLTPRDLAPLIAQAFLLPAVGAILRWFVYAPLAEAVRAGWEV